MWHDVKEHLWLMMHHTGRHDSVAAMSEDRRHVGSQGNMCMVAWIWPWDMMLWSRNCVMALFEVLGYVGGGHASDDGSGTRRLSIMEAMGGPTVQWWACNRVFGGVAL
jgi:hypothetical protein